MIKPDFDQNKNVIFASGPQEDRLVTRARELVCGPLKQKWSETLREAANQLYQVSMILFTNSKVFLLRRFENQLKSTSR